MLVGERAVRPILVGPPTRRRWHLGCPVDVDNSPKESGGVARDRALKLAQMAAREALQHAGLDQSISQSDEFDPDFGICVGTSKPPLDSLMTLKDYAFQDESLMADHWAWFFGGSLASQLAHTLKAGGPVSAPVSACATGLVAIIQAAQWIAEGRCSMVLAGGADASLNELVLNSYRRSGAIVTIDPESDADWMSQKTPDNKYADAVRPFCSDRQGFVIGEGAGLIVLESAEHAQKRGAKPLAELTGWATGSDGANLTSPPESFEMLGKIVNESLQMAQATPDQLSFVDTHGTGTVAGDQWEGRGLGRVLADRAAPLPAVAHKSQMGHLLGAAGAVESILAVESLCQRTLLPTPTFRHPDSKCFESDLLRLSPQPMHLELPNLALKVSFGFGGHLAAALFRSL